MDAYSSGPSSDVFDCSTNDCEGRIAIRRMDSVDLSPVDACIHCGVPALFIAAFLGDTCWLQRHAAAHSVLRAPATTARGVVCTACGSHTWLRWPQLPIHVAAAHGHVHTVKVLLSASAELSVNVCDAAGFTPLMHAAQHGRPHAVAFLLATGAHIRRTHSGLSPLHVACAPHARVRAEDAAEVVHLLLAAGADPWEPCTVGHAGAVLRADALCAASQLPSHVLDALLTAMRRCVPEGGVLGGEPKAASPAAWPPLACAVLCGSVSHVRLLLARGARWDEHVPGIGPVLSLIPARRGQPQDMQDILQLVSSCYDPAAMPVGIAAAYADVLATARCVRAGKSTIPEYPAGCWKP